MHCFLPQKACSHQKAWFYEAPAFWQESGPDYGQVAANAQLMALCLRQSSCLEGSGGLPACDQCLEGLL